ncbi:MAG: aspartyl/glutamyl-tRNA amidotransferase subunit C, partial [Holophagales bacterium]|nr:aspartyl/glutamyl-tRNA amidotransferase subunit C [Holophagales bacterium]
MSMDLEEIRQIARLARLEISDAEAPRLGRQLAEIVAFFETLQACDISAALEEERESGGAAADGDVPETAAAAERTDERPRVGTEGAEPDATGDDRVMPGLERDAMLRNAPEGRDGFLTVPKIKAAHGEGPP